MRTKNTTSLNYIKIPILIAFAWFAIDVVFEPEIFSTIHFGWVALFLVIISVMLLAIDSMQIANKAIEWSLLDEEQKKEKIKEEAANPQGWAAFVQSINGFKPMEQEKDLLLDHDYDGIEELDNTLPPWWLYGFYLTIIVGVIYFVQFTFYGAYNQDEEYKQEVAEAEVAIEKWRASQSNLIDYETVELLSDAGTLSKGKKIFDANCATCHMKNGAGNIGPNLTDKHWIHGGDIKTVYRIIADGVIEKGMLSWKGQFSPLQMQAVASYVLTEFKGKNVKGGKAPQGDIIVE